jgi:hypothetical protein
MGAPVNIKKPGPKWQSRPGSFAPDPASGCGHFEEWQHLAIEHLETAPVWKMPPPREQKPPPKCHAASSIDFLVSVLSSASDGMPRIAGNWKEVFLQALARAPIASVAARIAGVPRAQATAERMADPGFAQQWDAAMEEGIDEIEAAMYRSAVYGDEKPVFHQGKQTGWAVNYSHAMRSLLLKAWRPRIFGKDKNPKPEKRSILTLAEFQARMKEVRNDP